MRDEYDFSQGIPNPYVKANKVAVTIRLDKSIADYFKTHNIKKDLLNTKKPPYL